MLLREGWQSDWEPHLRPRPLLWLGLHLAKSEPLTSFSCTRGACRYKHKATGSRKRPKMLLVVTPGALRGISCATRQSCTQMVKYDESTLNYYQLQPPWSSLLANAVSLKQKLDMMYDEIFDFSPKFRKSSYILEHRSVHSS